MKIISSFLKIRRVCTWLGLMACATLQAQNDTVEVSPDAIFDKVYDVYGNSYKLSDVMISAKPKIINGLTVSTQTLCTSSGYFDLYFETGSGCEGSSPTEVARRNVLCQLFSDLSNFIVPANPSTKVNIWVRNIANLNAPSGVLGTASSFYTIPAGAPNVGGIVDGEIWKTIHSGTDSYTNLVSPMMTYGGTNLGFFHGIVAFNFNNYAWHTNLGQATALNNYDLYSVGMHEAMHALGFASLINYDGTSRLGTTVKYYSRYDLFLQNQAGINLITNTGLCSLYDYAFNPSLNPNTLLSPNPASCGGTIPSQSPPLNTTTCGTAVKFAGSVGQTVYTPNCYESGSSLSHLEDLCHLPSAYGNDVYYAMSNANGQGATYMKRFPKPEERMVLCDIGYRVNTTYGNNLYVDNFKDYQVAQCPGLWVGGVNDGITATGAFQWITPVNTPTTIIGSAILGNDFQATAFECLEDVYGMGVLNVNSGTNTTNITYTPSVPGVAVLRYIPVNANGEKGNITYVYIMVTTAGCSPTACNMITNGEFESTTVGCWLGITTTQVNCWSRYTASPDLFGRNCSTRNIPTSAAYAVPSADTWNNGANANNHFIALLATANTNSTFEESVQTTLTNPLIQGGVYTLRFQARVGNGASYANIPAKIAVCGSPFMMSSPGNDYNIAAPGLSILVNSINVPADMAWHSIAVTFTYTGTNNLNNLIVGYDGTQVFHDMTRLLFIDAFELSPASPNVSFVPPTPLCLGTVINNLHTYANPPGGTITGSGVTGTVDSYTFTASPVGTYNLTYTYLDNVGCEVDVPATVVVNTTASPTITVVASPSVTCAGGPVTLTASGASSYVWSPAVSCSAPCNVVTINPTSNITYNVTGTSGQCSSTSAIAVSVTTPSMCCKPGNVIVPDGATSTTYPSFASGLVVEIAGVFTINTNASYTNITFRMAPGAIIKVSATNTLTLNSCHLYSCSDMWDGIYLLQSGTNAGGIVMIGSTLEDAMNGIVANMASTTANALIRVSNSTFNKNYASIQYLNYTSSTLANLDVRQSNFTCTNSIYSFGTTLKAPYLNQRSRYGIFLGTVNNIQVGSSTASTALNRFDNLDYGVCLQNTNVKIVNNAFTMKGGMISSTTPIGVGVYAPNASMTVRSATVGGTAANEPNTFTDVFRGVDMGNMSKAIVSNNTFSCVSTPPNFPNGPTNFTSQFGVYLTNIKDQASVTTNTLTNFYYSIYHQRNTTTTSGCNPQITHNRNTINTGGTGYVSRGIFLGDLTTNTITTAALIEIRDNKLTDIVSYGIYASYILNNVQIIGTSPYSQYVQIRYGTGTAVRTGICLDNCKSAFVAYNAAYSTSNANANMVGISLNASLNSMVKCNTMYNIGSCLGFSGDCTGPFTSGNSYSAGILSNNFNNAQVGILVGSGGKVGVQGDATHPTANVWNGTAASYAIGQTYVLPLGGNTAANSPFYCRSTIPAEWPTNHAGTVAYVNNTTIINATGVIPKCPAIPASSFVIVSSDKDERGMTQSSTVQPSLSVEELADFNVNVYPNPNNGLFTLAADVEMKDVTIRVLNLMGEVLYEKTFKTFSRQEINLSEYSNGVYNIRINDANYTRYYKVVKQ